jgi:ABC-type sugar transport system permease subunit
MMSNSVQNQIRWLVIWQGVLALAGVGGSVWAFTHPGWGWVARAGVGILLLGIGIACGVAVFDLPRRVHRGRVITILVNYFGVFAAVVGALHFLGIFTGIDSLANTFGRGLPWLLVMFAGLFIGGLGDRFEGSPALAKQFPPAGRAIAIVGGVVFLWMVGIVPGVVSLFGKLFTQPLPLILIGSAILFTVTLWIAYRPAVSQALNAEVLSDEAISGYLFLSPNLLGFLLFFAGPLIFSLYISFTDWDAFGTKNWVGLQNYVEILTLDFETLDTPDQPANEALDIQKYSELGRFNLLGKSYIVGATDKLFWLSLRNTFSFVLMAVPLSVIPALFLANLLNSNLPGMKVYRAMYFLPSVAAVVGIALIWQLLYNAAIGYINYGITSAVTLINTVFSASLADPAIRWLSDQNTALLSLVIMVAWQTMGFNTVLFLAGLTNIPGVLYEAATVDGAGKWAQFWNVTIPMLAPTTFFVLTTTTIQAMQLFDQVFILMNPPEGPNNSTLTIVLYLYRNGFQNFRQGYGSAIAWVLFALIFGVTLLQFQRQRASQLEY